MRHHTVTEKPIRKIGLPPPPNPLFIEEENLYIDKGGWRLV